MSDEESRVPGVIFPAQDLRDAYADIDEKFLFIPMIRGARLYTEKVEGTNIEVLRVFHALGHADAYRADQEGKSKLDLIVRRAKLDTIWEAVDAVKKMTRVEVIRIELSRVYDGGVWSIDLLAGPERVLH